MGVLILFGVPTIHELPDNRISAGGRAPKFAVIDFGELLDVTHVDQDRNEIRI